MNIVKNIGITNRTAYVTYNNIIKELNRLRASMINDIYYNIKLKAAEYDPDMDLDGDNAARRTDVSVRERIRALREQERELTEE